METQRRHIVVSGRVQAVGFRYYAKLAADELGVTGWVQNLDNGDVEMEVLKNKHIRITKTKQKTIPVDPKEKSFRILDYYS